MDKETIFVEGIISKEISENAPKFILSNLSIKVNDLIVWLMDAKTKPYCKDGWINVQIKRGISGKHYTIVDTWQPSPRGNITSPTTSNGGGQSMAQVEKEFKNGEADLSQVPF